MSRWFAAAGLLLAAGCTIPPKDPFVAAERAVRRDDLLRALQAYDAVPVAHPRYPDARAAAGDIEQRMRRCHELILQALMLRGEWRDQEALEALRRAADHWPNQPSLAQWVAATEQRLRLFDEHSAVPTTALEDPDSSATPLFEVAPEGARGASAAGNQEDEVAIEIPATRVPEPLLPRSATTIARGTGLEVHDLSDPSVRASERQLANRDIPRQQGRPDAAANQDTRVDVLGAPRGALTGDSSVGQRPEALGQGTANGGAVGAGGKLNGSGLARSSVDRSKDQGGADSSGGAKRPLPTAENEPRRLPNGDDPVALGLVAVEVRLGRGELPAAVRDLIELARRFPRDVRVNLRLGRLLHQRALMHYGQGSVAAAIADWRRVLAIEPDNQAVRDLLARAQSESGSSTGRDKSERD